jgi:hypothetical protein
MNMNTNIKDDLKGSDYPKVTLPTLTPQQSKERTAQRNARAAAMRKKNAESLR